MEKSCETCKFVNKSHHDFPCRDCRCVCNQNSDEYLKRPLMWKARQEEDVVNHPSHYCQDGSMECIDEMVAVFGKEAVMNFCLLNVWKYRKRAVFKNGEEDLKKSDWYMKKYLELKGELYDRK